MKIIGAKARLGLSFLSFSLCFLLVAASSWAPSLAASAREAKSFLLSAFDKSHLLAIAHGGRNSYSAPLPSDITQAIDVSPTEVDVSDAIIVRREPLGQLFDPAAVLASVHASSDPGHAEWKVNPKIWGYQEEAVWLYLPLINAGDAAVTRALYLPYVSPSELDIFVFDANGILLRSVKNGTTSSYAHRDMKMSKMGAHIEIPAQTTVQVLMRQRTFALFNTQFRVSTVESSEHFQFTSLSFFSLYLGLALALLIHNLSLFFSMRDPVYVAYLLFILTVTLSISFIAGFYAMIWDDIPEGLGHLTLLTPTLASMAGAYFSCSYLRLHYKTSNFARLLLAIGFFCICCMPIQFIYPYQASHLYPLQSLGVSMTVITACLHQIYRGERYPAFLLAAVLGPVASIIAYFIGNLILHIAVPSDVITYSFAFEMLLSSIGLSHRIYIFRQKQHELEAQRTSLLHQTKMRALQFMAGEVAHEVNNPLMIINGHAEIIGRLSRGTTAEEKKVRESASKIMQTVDRVAFIVHALISFSQNDPQSQQRLHVMQDVIEQALALCRSRIESLNIDLRLDIPADKIWVSVESSRLLQVVYGILVNALEAIDGSPSRILILTMVQSGEAPFQRMSLTISDSGPGLTPDVQEMIFRPSFSAQNAQEGVGLGLSRSQEIIQKHGGLLYLDTTAKMTTFVIELPAVASEKQAIA